jgi:hypothetical protein
MDRNNGSISSSSSRAERLRFVVATLVLPSHHYVYVCPAPRECPHMFNADIYFCKYANSKNVMALKRQMIKHNSNHILIV